MSPLIKSKVGFLALGIFTGFLLGGSVVWWYSVVNNGDWVFRQKIGQFFNSFFDNENDSLSNVKTNIETTKTTHKKDKSALSGKLAGDNASDTLNLNDSLQGDLEYLEGMNIKQSGLSTDSLYDDSLSFNGDANDPDKNIIVVKDELLFARSVRLAALDSLARAGHALDSLLILDNNPVKNPKNLFRIEFWRSPVNYKGYKMSNNKLVLYGIYDFENTSLHYINDDFYLKSKEDFYKLETTEEFLPLIKTKKPI